jgi:hypothetical protein
MMRRVQLRLAIVRACNFAVTATAAGKPLAHGAGGSAEAS